MTGPEFDDIAALWQQEPDPAEQALMQELAAKVTRRAKLAELSDLGIVALFLAGVLLVLFSAPAPATIAAGALIVAAGAWITWKRHVLSEMAQMLDTSDRAAFLESAIRSARANLKRSRVGLWVLIPGGIAGIILKYTYLSGGRIHALDELVQERLPQMAWPALVLALIFFVLLRSHSRIRAEVSNLRRLQREYNEEAHLEGDGEGDKTPP